MLFPIQITTHERKGLKILLENPFEFPKSAEELFKDRLQIERNQFDKNIHDHEKIDCSKIEMGKYI